MTLISKSALTELAVGNWNHVTQWAAYLAYDKSEILFATYQFSKAFKKSKITVISERVQILKNPNQRQLHAYHKRVRPCVPHLRARERWQRAHCEAQGEPSGLHVDGAFRCEARLNSELCYSSLTRHGHSEWV